MIAGVMSSAHAVISFLSSAMRTEWFDATVPVQCLVQANGTAKRVGVSVDAVLGGASLADEPVQQPDGEGDV